jgi:Protein of unknown function (DUF4229)
MSSVVRYTLARLGLFGAAFGLVWALGGYWLVWDRLTLLWTALVALAMSGVVSFWLLGGLRSQLASDVEERARRVAARIDESRRAEDDPPP